MKKTVVPIVVFVISALLTYLILTNLIPSKVGFRGGGGSEAIGGRTGGTAYSGGDTVLQPGDY